MTDLLAPTRMEPPPLEPASGPLGRLGEWLRHQDDWLYQLHRHRAGWLYQLPCQDD